MCVWENNRQTQQNQKLVLWRDQQHWKNLSQTDWENNTQILKSGMKMGTLLTTWQKLKSTVREYYE